MFENTYIRQRIAKGELLRENHINPYANKVLRSITNADFKSKYNELTRHKTQDSSRDESVSESVVGRIKLMRVMGKALFIKIEDVSGVLQVYVSESSLAFGHMVAKNGGVRYKDAAAKEASTNMEGFDIASHLGSPLGDPSPTTPCGYIDDKTLVTKSDEEDIEFGKNAFKLLLKTLEVGDIINATGFPFTTKTGELTLNALEFRLLSKAIIPLPEKFHGLSDIELRYRMRYLDLIVNAKVRDTFILRSRVISLFRRFFESRGFLEVETPMLHPIPGGANARPFITYHNTLEENKYLRIAPELYLKRLIVGGFERIYEINRNFRNEGMDHSHNPEFTMVEFYYAYKTYADLIVFVKELFCYLLDELGLGRKLVWGEQTIDMSEFKIISYKDSIVQIGGVASEVLEDEGKMLALLDEHSIDGRGMSYGKHLEELFDLFVEKRLINPTFIVDYPVEISPLSRRNDDDARIADRFELFIGGTEVANAFSELNDPLDQYERFKAQVELKDSGDDEALHMDEDYCTALGYGMAPTAGCGIGIDRLVMVLTNAKTIKDVILFPAMRMGKETKDMAIEALGEEE